MLSIWIWAKVGTIRGGATHVELQSKSTKSNRAILPIGLHSISRRGYGIELEAYI